MPSDPTAPQQPLESYLASFLNADYRESRGALGMLRLLEPTREALRDYERQLVAQARAERTSWEDVGEALGVPKQTAHRRHA